MAHGGGVLCLLKREWNETMRKRVIKRMSARSGEGGAERRGDAGREAQPERHGEKREWNEVMSGRQSRAAAGSR